MKHIRSTAALLAATTGLAVTILTGLPAAAAEIHPLAASPASHLTRVIPPGDGGGVVPPRDEEAPLVIPDVPGDDSAGTSEPDDPADEAPGEGPGRDPGDGNNIRPIPEDGCAMRTCIVDLAKWELKNTAHNREKEADNCNYFSGAWGSGDAGTSSRPCGTHAGTRWRINNWCSDFARYVWKHSAANVSGLDAWAGSFYRANKTNGHYHSKASGYTPKKGDAVLYDWDGVPDLGENGWGVDHVGVFEKHDGDKIVVIEGNTDGGKSRQGIFRKKRTTADVVGYVSPRAAG